jgi:hypothetical protein
MPSAERSTHYDGSYAERVVGGPGAGAGAVLPAADDEDDDAIHGDDVNRAFQAAFVGVVAR